KDTTTIIDAKGDEDKITQRVEEIKTQIDETKSNYEKETLQDRLAKFIGGIAIVHVGGMTEVEMKEKKDRVDDALHATKAALEEGILPGGGIALLNAATMLESRLDSIESNDEHKGYQIVLNACEAPFSKILINAGFTKERIYDIDTELQWSKDKWLGFNPRADKTVNMFE
ncbi:MAG: TCP-1/cpn60 chaperonin family protein, partial [Chitinophagales bacterium]